MEYCIGIDLGGTNIAGGVATLDGLSLIHILKSVRAPPPEERLRAWEKHQTG